MTANTVEAPSDVAGMANFLSVEFEVLGRLTHAQRRYVRMWLREVAERSEQGAYTRAARRCHTKRNYVRRAVKRFRRMMRHAQAEKGNDHGT